MTYQAVIDLGSNTIRLCIYEVERITTRKDADKTTPGTTCAPLGARDTFEWNGYRVFLCLNSKIMAGLASFVEKGRISEKGIKKAIKAIQGHQTQAALLGCTNIAIFATAVLRNCVNSYAATTEIEQATGLPITILSNQEEAHLGFVGANLITPLETGTLIDIGGGSTELTIVKNGSDTNVLSLPQGSLSSFSNHVAAILPTEAELSAIAASFQKHLATLTQNNYQTPQLYGIGGSIRSVVKVYGDVCNNGVRENTVTAAQLDAIFEAYTHNPNAFAHLALRSIPDRIHTFLPGCVILRELFAFCNGTQLSICKHGVREGYLVERVLENGSGKASKKANEKTSGKPRTKHSKK